MEWVKKFIFFLIHYLLFQFCLNAQIVYFKNARIRVDCINCENPSLPPTYKIELLSIYGNTLNVPQEIEVLDNNLNPYPQVLYLNDSITNNCEKEYLYGPIYFTCEAWNETYYFIIKNGNVFRRIHDSSEFFLKFEINVLGSPTLFKSSNIQLVNLPTNLAKSFNEIEIGIVENNSSKFYTEFELSSEREDSLGIILKDKIRSSITLIPQNLNYGYHSYKIRSIGQLEFDGGAVHESESIYSFFVDTLKKPIEWFSFQDGNIYNRTSNTLRIPKNKDSLSLPFLLSLNGYPSSQLSFQFNIHGDSMRKMNYSILEDTNDTLSGNLHIKNIYPIKNIRQIMSLKVLDKESCTLLFGKNWDLVFDSTLSDLSESKSQSLLSIFPNPFNSYLEINSQKEGKLELINNIGITVFVGLVRTGINRFYLSELNEGLYFAKVTSSDSFKIYRVLKTM
jgi:hypothetical protein